MGEANTVVAMIGIETLEAPEVRAPRKTREEKALPRCSLRLGA